MNLSWSRIGGTTARVILALAAVGASVPAYRYAEVAALRVNSPLKAAEIAPHDAKIFANSLGGKFDTNPQFKPGASDLEKIQTALIAQPLEPKLLSILGLSYEAFGKKKQAAEAMQIANRASRRDSVSGLYLIESASASGDVKGTLRHYNAVLLSHPDIAGTLFPILSSAIAYPEIRTELRPYLQAGSKWVPGFLAVAVEQGSVADIVALLLPLPQTLLNEEHAPSLARVLHRIGVEGDRGHAVRFAGAIVPSLSPATLADLSPSPETLDKRLGLFAWTFPAVDGIRVEIGSDKSLQIGADPLSRGLVAVRDILLEGGAKYQLDQRLEYGSESTRIAARWAADCITKDGTVRFWEQRLPNSGTQMGYRSVLTAPQDCKVVRMSLFAEGPDGQIPSTLVINGLLISKAS